MLANLDTGVDINLVPKYPLLFLLLAVNLPRRYGNETITMCIVLDHVMPVARGHVQLRNWAMEEHRPRRPPKPRSERDAKLLVKTKLCWFHAHHPQGCPRHTSDCPYAHGLCELRMRPDFSTVDPVPLTTYP